MPATAENLRELHSLHQRAKALRDRLNSGPKTLAARESVLAARRSALETAQKALKDSRAHIKTRETQLQAQQSKIEDLKVKLNQIKKQAEYDAIRNQIAHDQATAGRIEDEVLEAMGRKDERAAELAALEAETRALADEVATLRADLEAKAGPQQAQLRELEAALAAAEAIIPEDRRDQYRRVVKQRGADALAAIDDNACTGCNVAVTAQMMNDLINAQALVFCRTCGRLLYLAEEDQANTRRTGR